MLQGFLERKHWQMHRRDQEKIAVRCLLELEAMGIQVEVVDDVDCVRDAISPLRNGPGLGLDADRLLLTPANTFWVLARSSGKLIVAFGVRVDDLGGQSAQRFLERSIKVIFDVEVTASDHQIFRDKYWGRAAYFGGFVGDTAKGISRHSETVFRLLAGYAHHCAFIDFKSDVNYSFHRGLHEFRGAHYGFLRRDPFVWTTDEPMYPDGNPDWVMQLLRDDLPSLLNHASRSFQYSLTKNDQDRVPVVVHNTAS